MDTQGIVETVRRLPADERVRLVEELWDEVAKELERKPVNAAQERLLESESDSTERTRPMLRIGKRHETIFS